MAVYKNLSTKELYASIPNTSFIAEMFKQGIKMGSTQLAISAMEELLLRGDNDLVYYGIKSALENGDIKLGTSMCSMLARSLLEGCKGTTDPILSQLGKALLRVKTDFQFLSSSEMMLDIKIPEEIKEILKRTDIRKL